MFEVFVVGEDLNAMLRPFKVVAPVVETFDNSEKFLVVDIIVAFGGRHRA